MVQGLGPGVDETVLFPQHLVPTGRLHFVGHPVFVRQGAVKIGPGVLLPQLGQHGPYRGLLGVGGVFQPQPQQVRKGIYQSGIFHFLEHRMELVRIVVFPGEPHHGIEVQIRCPIIPVGQKIRLEAVVGRGIPDHIQRPPALGIVF